MGARAHLCRLRTITLHLEQSSVQPEVISACANCGEWRMALAVLAKITEVQADPPAQEIVSVGNTHERTRRDCAFYYMVLHHIAYSMPYCTHVLTDSDTKHESLDSWLKNKDFFGGIFWTNNYCI